MTNKTRLSLLVTWGIICSPDVQVGLNFSSSNSGGKKVSPFSKKSWIIEMTADQKGVADIDTRIMKELTVLYGLFPSKTILFVEDHFHLHVNFVLEPIEKIWKNYLNSKFLYFLFLFSVCLYTALKI